MRDGSTLSIELGLRFMSIANSLSFYEKLEDYSKTDSDTITAKYMELYEKNKNSSEAFAMLNVWWTELSVLEKYRFVNENYEFTKKTNGRRFEKMKTKLFRKKLYIAFNGKEFDSSQECKEYEK